MEKRKCHAGYVAQYGFSLIEQIMVLLIVSVLAGLAVPPLRGLLSRNQLQVAQTDFMAALQHARESAVMSGKTTLFCPSSDGSSCSNDTRWDRGWLLAHDQDGDHQPDADLLYTGHGYAGKLAVLGSVGRHYVRFRPDGSASGSNITLLFCLPGDHAQVLSVVVSNAGRIRGAVANADQAANCLQTL